MSLEFFNQGNTSAENSNIQKNNSKRKEDIVWSFEEDYIFFQAHGVIGNNWTQYCPFLLAKSSKDIKNHFHTCIIKTVRRILLNKIDGNIKDLMRSFYALKYINGLLEEMSAYSSKQLKTIKRNKYKFDLKHSIKNKKISKQIVNEYYRNVVNELLSHPLMIKLVKDNTMIEDMTYDKVSFLFRIITNANIYNKCYEAISKGGISNKSDIDRIQLYLDQNSMYAQWNKSILSSIKE